MKKTRFYIRVGTRDFYRMPEVWLDHVPLTRELEPSVYIPFDWTIVDCASGVTKTMVGDPILDKYAISPTTLFTTNKCPISKVEITDGTTGANLITSETALSDVTQYSATGHAVDNLITSD